ncbi:hypothetical protein BGZ65_004085, partial [Modicella reniformis]
MDNRQDSCWRNNLGRNPSETNTEGNVGTSDSYDKDQEDDLVDLWEDVFGGQPYGGMELDNERIEVVVVDDDPSTSPTAAFRNSQKRRAGTSATGGMTRPFKTRKTATLVEASEISEDATAGDEVAHVSQPSSEGTIDLIRSQQRRYAALRDQRVKAEVQCDRKVMQTKSTKTVYGRYQKHWIAWCDRKGYPDHNVKQDRFLVYMSENLAMEPDPGKGVIPLRVKPRGKPKEVPEGGPDDDDKAVGTLPSYQTVDAYIKAANDLYCTQVADPMNAGMRNEPPPRSGAIQTLMHSYKLRLAESETSSIDSTNLMIKQGHEMDALKQVMRDGWTYNYPHLGGSKRHSFIGLRNRLNVAWCHFMMSRSENMRMATIPNIFSHVFYPEKDSDQRVLGIVLLMLRGKTNSEDKENYGVM